MNKNKQQTKGDIYMPIIQVALVVYLISAGIMGIYFNWLYAVEHGFLAWFFFGEIISTLKGLVWPFFIYF